MPSMAMSPPLSKLQVCCFQSPLPWDEIWRSIIKIDPHQTYGWPILLAIWGRIVGWSEVAVRALSLFFGMLTLAWVYRTGRDLLAPRAGLFAALLLSASVFFLAYMIHARAFTLIALCSTLCILVLLAPCAESPANQHGCTSWPFARRRWLTLFALLQRAVSACPRPVSSALRAKEPALVAARPADRRRCLAGHAAAARFSGRTERYSRRRRLCTAQGPLGNGC